MDAILVLIQVGQGDDWSDRSLPEVVAGFASGGRIRDFAMQWLASNHPDAAHH